MKVRSDAGLALFFAAVTLTGCAKAPETPPAPPPPPALTQAVVDQEIQKTVAALSAGDAAAASAGWASDGVFINARGKYETQAGIQAFWTEALKSGAGKGLKLETVKFGASGDMAYAVSRFSGGITAPSGHTIVVVQRQADGSLKTLVQFSLPDPPAKK